ncbi:MAG: transcriptional repressor [Caldiserica bacterium]|nr:transcriptional repressor [Caldisericota bacterium]
MDKIIDSLKRQGFRITKPRKAVLKLLMDHKDENLEAREIQEELKRDGLDIDIATIYRILEMLFEQRVVHKSNFSQQHAHFGIRKPFEVHVICRNCGSIDENILEIDDRLKQDQINELLDKDFEAEDISIEIYGLCGKCRYLNGK